MKKEYEKKLMNIQAELVSLCMGAVENLSVNKIYLYEDMADYGYSFNALVEINGEPQSLGKAGLNRKINSALLREGVVELKKLRRLCEEYEVPRPTEIKATYDVETGGFEMECEYDTIDVDVGEALEIWMDEIKAAKAAGTQA